MNLPARREAMAAALATFLAATAHAETEPPDAAPVHSWTANVSLTSDYIFRGISQTGGKPAVQGGFDYSHASGFYLGTWASNASWLEDFGAYRRSSVEWDVYGGLKRNFPGSEDWSYDVGIYGYLYPGHKNAGAVSADTWELYGAISWKWLGAKLSYTLDDYFGARPTGHRMDGTIYVDLYANYPIADTGVMLLAHYGILDCRHDGAGDNKVSYNDWKLGASYTVPVGVLKGVEAGAYYTGNNAKQAFYTDLTGYDTAKDRAVVYVKKTF